MFNHFNHENRHTVSFAMEEATDLGHAEIGTDHMILGMLCNARGSTYELLTGLGFTLVGAREAVRANRMGDDEQTVDAQRDAEQVDDDRDALKSIGIDLDKVADAIRTSFGTDITDGWSKRGPQRRAQRGPRRGEGFDDRYDHGCDDDHRCDDGRGRGGRGHGGRSRGDRDHGGRGHGGGGHGHGGRHDDPRMRGMGGPQWGNPMFGDGPWDAGRGRRGPRGRGGFAGPFGRLRFSPAARAAMGEGAKLARESESGEFTAFHLLAGIMAVDDARSRALIETVTTPEAVKDALGAAV